jgi:hypothetical protein
LACAAFGAHLVLGLFEELSEFVVGQTGGSEGVAHRAEYLVDRRAAGGGADDALDVGLDVEAGGLGLLREAPLFVFRQVESEDHRVASIWVNFIVGV